MTRVTVGRDARWSAVEFAVRRDRPDGRRGPLWFTGTRTMRTAAAVAVRALRVWTTGPPGDRRPARVAFLNG